MAEPRITGGVATVSVNDMDESVRYDTEALGLMGLVEDGAGVSPNSISR